MTPAQQREKIPREFISGVAAYERPWHWSAQAKRALLLASGAADAIPDAPPLPAFPFMVGDLPTTGLASAESLPVPSRAELIELMIATLEGARFLSLLPLATQTAVRERMARVLDALIKAGVVRL